MKENREKQLIWCATCECSTLHTKENGKMVCIICHDEEPIIVPENSI